MPRTIEGYWRSSVDREIAAAHHNGPKGSKCHTNHGHTWKIRVSFVYEALDQWGWGPDFHAVKVAIDSIDHKDLNEILSEPASAENVGRYIAQTVYEMTGEVPTEVSVDEGSGNSVVYYPFRESVTDENFVSSNRDLRSDSSG